MLGAMRRCWSGAPALRPSAAALVSALAAPEYAALADAAAAAPAAAAAALAITHAEEEGGWEIWYGGEAERAHSLLCTRARYTHHHTRRLPPGDTIPPGVTARARATRTTTRAACRQVTLYPQVSLHARALHAPPHAPPAAR
ncbi:uncharacterized protein LOC114360917 [Ostrinia furnacalis]|uniref:uncharacterized protein LOC114360917 n=1 Tax=Ostrinia furnacalis TaxID=93504 RepID=UPI001040D4C9|nr:uncharacterized protein LOC114360917 [Ostrinia furnacalis]